jgi:hypothetical protein
LFVDLTLAALEAGSPAGSSPGIPEQSLRDAQCIGFATGTVIASEEYSQRYGPPDHAKSGAGKFDFVHFQAESPLNLSEYTH